MSCIKNLCGSFDDWVQRKHEQKWENTWGRLPPELGIKKPEDSTPKIVAKVAFNIMVSLAFGVWMGYSLSAPFASPVTLGYVTIVAGSISRLGDFRSIKKAIKTFYDTPAEKVYRSAYKVILFLFVVVNTVAGLACAKMIPAPVLGAVSLVALCVNYKSLSLYHACSRAKKYIPIKNMLGTCGDIYRLDLGTEGRRV